MVYKIDPVLDRPCVEEFRINPIGHHSPNLQRILNIMRFDRSGSQTILVTRVPFKEWVLGVMPPNRSDPVLVAEDAEVFHTREEAEWAVFCARWELHTGEKITSSRETPLPERPKC